MRVPRIRRRHRLVCEARSTVPGENHGNESECLMRDDNGPRPGKAAFEFSDLRMWVSRARVPS
jgi:hypothetical protein